MRQDESHLENTYTAGYLLQASKRRFNRQGMCIEVVTSIRHVHIKILVTPYVVGRCRDTDIRKTVGRFT
jgi:hypothetical protein